jgi:uncharacterized protein (TIGR02444 family)
LKIDVNLLLFCAWMGTQSLVLTSRQLEAAGLAVEVWHDEVVRPLRGVRQQIKALARDEFEAFRSQVKSLELEAEQIEQAMLFAHAPTIAAATSNAKPREAIAENVRAYVEIARSRAGPTGLTSVSCLIAAALRRRPG